jgi:hypothetical protein
VFADIVKCYSHRDRRQLKPAERMTWKHATTA